MKSHRMITPTLRVGTLSRCCAAALALGLGGQLAHAQSGQLDRDDEVMEVGLLFGAANSNNVRRATTNTESGSYALVGVELDILQASRWLNATVGSDLEYRSYSTEGLDNERVGIVDAELEFLALPERLSWVVGVRGGQGRTDPFGVESPENREDVNLFDTGPRLTFPFGSRSDLRLSAIAGRREFEQTTELDSDATDIEVGFHHAVSATSEFGVIVSSSDVDYDAVGQIDNEVERAYVSYIRTLATGLASIALGTNQVGFGGEPESDPYLVIDWQREVGARSRFISRLSNQLVDATDSVDYDRLVVYDTGSVSSDGSILISQDVYEATALLTALTTGSARTRFTVAAEFSESRYKNDNLLDNDMLKLTLSTERDLSTRSLLGLTADLAMRDFKNGFQQEDDDTMIELFWQRSFAGPFSARLSYRRNERSGTSAFGYDESTWTFDFRYDINPRGPSSD